MRLGLVENLLRQVGEVVGVGNDDLDRRGGCGADVQQFTMLEYRLHGGIHGRSPVIRFDWQLGIGSGILYAGHRQGWMGFVERRAASEAARTASRYAAFGVWILV